MKTLYRRTVVVAVMLALSISLSWTYASAAGKELKKFNVGYLASTGHTMYFIAKEKGYFEQEGLDVQLFLFTNSGEGLNAISAGKLDAGSFGTAPPLVFITKGVDVTIFGGQMSEGHGIVAKPEKVDQFRDLKNYAGKTIATVRLSTGDVVFRGGLHHAGVDWKKNVTIKELDSPGAVLEAIKKGSVDAGILWPPFLTLAEQQGLKVARRSGDVQPNHTCCRQSALTSRLKTNEADYIKFMRALIKAHAFYKTNQDETVDIASKYVKIDKAILKKDLYSGNLYISPDPEKAGVVSFWQNMNDAGYISSKEKIESHINTEIFRKALDQLIKEYPNEKDYKALKASFKA
ncbi:MAG: putative aliphatic sulfonates-binding protein precursor [Syntrophorhabdaceae bacterium PtaU1.Bin034]|jgi:NitT/TauT family transport system substrate-binding protein|nr:MAG: putative aliphatic sulfonates-binding protein precursor [Syntrophorhabdaceae bacterium PtaU1.Bin034]